MERTVMETGPLPGVGGGPLEGPLDPELEKGPGELALDKERKATRARPRP